MQSLNSLIAPSRVAGTGDVPPVGWTWTAQTTLAENQYQHQVDGTYTPGGNIVWGNPYIASFKVGNLQALSAETGSLNVSGTCQVTGILKSTNFVSGSAGYQLLSDGSVQFNNIAARGTITGGAITGWGWSASGYGGGFYLGTRGILVGDYGTSSRGYFELDVLTGNWNMNGISYNSTTNKTTFSGALNAATGTFSGALSAATGSFSGTLNAVTGTFGAVTVMAGGNIKAGKTAYSYSNSGFWLGMDGPDAKFIIGNTSKFIDWNGSNLLIGGDIIATGNIQARGVTNSISGSLEGYSLIMTPSAKIITGQNFPLGTFTKESSTSRVFAHISIIITPTLVAGLAGQTGYIDSYIGIWAGGILTRYFRLTATPQWSSILPTIPLQAVMDLTSIIPYNIPYGLDFILGPTRFMGASGETLPWMQAAVLTGTVIVTELKV